MVCLKGLEGANCRKCVSTKTRKGQSSQAQEEETADRLEGLGLGE